MNKGPNVHVLKVTLNDTHTFLAGGKDINQDTIPTAMIYDWSTDTWTFLESMLSPRVLYGSCGAVTDPITGDIHVSLTSFQVKQHIFQWSYINQGCCNLWRGCPPPLLNRDLQRG